MEQQTRGWGYFMLEERNQYPTYEEILSESETLAKKYPECVIFRIIGQSHDDRLIPMIRIGTGTETLICTAGIHGRESVNPVLLLKIAEIYCHAYRYKDYVEGYSVYDLLNQYSICMIPLVNPDGYEIALRGYGAIHNPMLRHMCKMKAIPAKEWKFNARAVDLNRNFPSKTYIQQQFYEYPASENETQAVMRIFQEYESIAYVDFHSRGKIIYYYRHTMSWRYNQNSHKLAKGLQKLSDYELAKKNEEISTGMSGGHSVHYYSEYTGRPALTIETVADKAEFPLDYRYLHETLEEIKSIPLGILKMA